MEASGLAERQDYGESPPRVGYRLTPLGFSLEPVLMAMHDWALEHAPARHPLPAGSTAASEARETAS